MTINWHTILCTNNICIKRNVEVLPIQAWHSSWEKNKTTSIHCDTYTMYRFQPTSTQPGI